KMVGGPDGANNWLITSADAGNLLGGRVLFSAIANLRGGALADGFSVYPNGRIDGTLDGGGGTNTLDYSGFATGVRVNLTTGSAPGVGGGAASRGRHGPDVIGASFGHYILLCNHQP